MRYTIKICQGISCQNCLSDDLFRYARNLLKDSNLIELEQVNCMNLCSSSSNMEVIDNESGENKIYSNIDYSKIEEVINNL